MHSSELLPEREKEEVIVQGEEEYPGHDASPLSKPGFFMRLLSILCRIPTRT